MSDFTEVSRGAYVAISSNDLDAFLALTDPNVEFTSLIEGRTYHGHDGVREWWGNVINRLAGVGIDLEEVVDEGDTGSVKMSVSGEASGLPTAIWQAARVEGGKAVWWGVFASEDEARKAVGSGN